jgi:hypothetical protein
MSDPCISVAKNSFVTRASLGWQIYAIIPFGGCFEIALYYPDAWTDIRHKTCSGIIFAMIPSHLAGQTDSEVQAGEVKPDKEAD